MKVFRCRPITAVRHPLGPASESLQGMNPRERAVIGLALAATKSMGAVEKAGEIQLDATSG